jgi:flagellar protein FlbD
VVHVVRNSVGSFGSRILHVIQRALRPQAQHPDADGRPVIELHRIHGNGTLFVNPDLIETIESRPDTVVTLVNKHRYIVEDSVSDVVQRIVDFRARIATAAGTDGDHAAGVRVLSLNDDQEQAA